MMITLLNEIVWWLPFTIAAIKISAPPTYPPSVTNEISPATRNSIHVVISRSCARLCGQWQLIPLVARCN